MLALRVALLASTALALVPASVGPASAACDTTFSPNTVVCSANTATTETVNTNAGTASSVDRSQDFDSGGNVAGSISPGVTVGGYGLGIETTENGASLTFTNNGVVNQATSIAGGSGALQLTTSTGAITYNSANGATIDGVAAASLMLFSRSSAATGAITAHVNGNVGNTGVIGSGYGVLMQTYGGVPISLDGTGNISGRTGIGVNTLNATNAADDGDITIGGSGNITYSDGYGIQIMHGPNAGTVTVNRSGTITGAGSGVGGNNIAISVSSSGTGGVFVTGTGAISDARFGMLISGTDNVTVAPGASITNVSNGGISIQLTGTATANVTSAFDITVSAGSGISANTNGANTVNVTAGTVSGGIFGVSQYSNAGGLLTFNMSGGTVLASSTNSSAAAVSANQNTTGDIIINQTGGSIGLAGTPAAATGILAKTHGTGTIDLTADRIVAASNGIDAQVDGVGTARVVTNGAVNSIDASAVRTSAATGSTTIVNRNRLEGGSASAGVVHATSTTGTISITNAVAGFIGSNLASPDTQLAIFTSGGPTQITNNGIITGQMTLGNSANTVNNTTIWNTNGVNDFGSGTTTLTNSGTLNVGAAARFTGGTLVVDNTGFGNIVGPLTIDTGTWSNNALITGDVTLNGGVLGGTGTIVGNTTINTGGVFAPGNSIGTTNVTGNVNFAGGTYQVEFSSGAADKTVATGTATLTGGTVQAVQVGSGFTVGQTYNILSAAGGLGGTTFAGLNISGAIVGHLTYDPTNVYFVVGSIGLADVLAPGTINQRAVAGGIDTALNGGASAGFFAPVLSLTGAALGNALDQLSGEVSTGAQRSASNMTGQFLGMMVDPFVNGRTDDAGNAGGISFAPERRTSFPADVALAYAGVMRGAPKQPSFGQRWSVWATPFGGYNKTNGDSTVGSSNVIARTYGVAAGTDYRLTSDTTIGVALAGGGSNWSLAQGLGSGSGDAFQAGVYGVTRFGAAYVAGSAAFANHWMSTDRTSFGGDRLSAKFRAQVYGGRLETGYRMPMAAATVTPYAALRAMAINIGSYAETDLTGGGFGLNVAARSATETRGEIGARFDKAVRFNTMPLKLRAQAAWIHDWIDDPSMSATFQTLPGAGFVVTGAAPPKNLLLASIGSDLQLAPGWLLSGKLESELGKGSQTYNGTASLRYRW